MHAVGTIRLDRLQDCPFEANKDLIKNGRGTRDYHCDTNSGIMAVKWVDNSVVNLASNFVGGEPVRELERWCKKEKVRKKHSTSPNCATMQQKHGRCRLDAHVAIIVSNTV